MKNTSVTLLVVGDSGEALLLRAMLENLGVQVFTQFIGTPSEFLNILSEQNSLSAIWILSAHGNENGLIFGEYGEGTDVSMLIDEAMPPSVLEKLGCTLDKKLIISTACCTGTMQFVTSFHNLGAEYYAAPESYPDGAFVPVFLNVVFYNLFVEKMPIKKAFEMANAAFPTSTPINLYQNNTTAISK